MTTRKPKHRSHPDHKRLEDARFRPRVVPAKKGRKAPRRKPKHPKPDDES